MLTLSFFSSLRGGNQHRHHVAAGGGGGGRGVVVPDSNRLKPPRWPSRLRSKEAREPVRATHRAPPAHIMHRLRSRRARQSGSPTGLLGGPEALIYQRLSLTPNGESGGPKAPCPSASAASAAPPPVDPLGVGAPHPRSHRCLLPKHNLLTERGHGPPPSLARQQCPEDRRRREVQSDFHDEIAARPRPRRTEFQRVLRRIHARIAMVATRGRVLPDSVPVFTKAPVSGEHLRHSVSQGGGRSRFNQASQFGRTASRTLSPGARSHVEAGPPSVEQGPSSPQRRRPLDRYRPTDPECGGKFRDTLVPAVQTGGTRRAPPLLPPKWCGSPSLPWWPPSCATSWPSGDCGG